MENKYFDLHYHPSAKAFLTAIRQEDKKSPWKLLRAFCLEVFSPILRSQSNFSQLQEGKVRLSVMAVVPLEKGFSEYWLIEHIVTNLTALSKDFIQKINRNEYTYYDLLLGEIDFIFHHLQHQGKKVMLLKSIEDSIDHPHTLNVVLSVEGSHALWHRGGQNIDEVLLNLKALKKRADCSFLYLTLTHLTHNDHCNHAFGAKITKKDTFKPHPFLKGISPGGLKLIDECFDRSEGKRILIDVKHMSYYARKQFYAYRKSNYPELPILASHVGLTGFPFSDIANRIERVYHKNNDDQYVAVTYKADAIQGIGEGERNRTCFNPWSINLYDEEILEIIASDGLMGIILDQRVLGFDRLKEEYFNKAEFTELLQSVQPETSSFAPAEDSEFKIDELKDLYPEADKIGRKRRHLRFLCNNILHIVKVGGEKAWAHICIGSDFDGLINPINNCKSADELPALETDLLRMLEEMIGEDRASQYHSRQLPAKVRNIMFDNGLRFMGKYFTRSFLGEQHFAI